MRLRAPPRASTSFTPPLTNDCSRSKEELARAHAEWRRADEAHQAERRELRGVLHHSRRTATERQQQLTQDKQVLLAELERAKEEAEGRLRQQVALLEQRLQRAAQAAQEREEALHEHLEQMQQQVRGSSDQPRWCPWLTPRANQIRSLGDTHAARLAAAHRDKESLHAAVAVLGKVLCTCARRVGHDTALTRVSCRLQLESERERQTLAEKALFAALLDRVQEHCNEVEAHAAAERVSVRQLSAPMAWALTQAHVRQEELGREMTQLQERLAAASAVVEASPSLSVVPSDAKPPRPQYQQATEQVRDGVQLQVLAHARDVYSRAQSRRRQSMRPAAVGETALDALRQVGRRTREH